MNNIMKKKTDLFTAVYLLALTFCSITTLYGGEPLDGKNKQLLNKITTNDSYQSFTINNLFNYYGNNGDGSFNTYWGSSGLEFPKGSGNTVVYEDGFLFGGITRTSPSDPTRIVKVGGSAYRHGLQAGRIITSGTAATTPVASNPSDPANRIFKVRPDINPSAIYNEAIASKLKSEELDYVMYKEPGASTQKIYDQYIADWNEWPASQGAPFKDNNGNGTYEPAVDVPGVPGTDQTLWHVSNDLDAVRTKFLYGSDPIGLELQRTIWGHKRSGPFGNMIFTKYRVINKSGANVDSMYLTQWADSDLGGAGDDYCGCDTLLSLGYMYNGKENDERYGTKVPAVGYDFFQGPIVPGAITDSAIFDGKIKQGFKNLPMTSFVFFIGGNATYSDPTQATITGTIMWYRMMKGLIGNNGAPFINPITGKVTTYVLSGDPVTGTGWVDGIIAPPGDRRFALSSGPFTMANGDTQEVVTAVIVGQGADRLTSISVLKFYDKYAQAAYNSNFDLASAPPTPIVKVVNADGAILLDWGNEATAKLAESQNKNGYKFQGYNIYQSKTSAYSPNNSILLATYDVVDDVGAIRDEVFDPITSEPVVKRVQFGTNSGIQRYYKVTIDAFTKQPLVNGRAYYFFITAYNYNPSPNAVPNNFESAPVLIEVLPQSPAPGIRYGKRIDDMLSVTHSSGVSEGDVTAMVVDPEKLTGHDYKVTFDTLAGKIYWKLIDLTLNTIVLDKQFNSSGDFDYYTVDGLLVKVMGPSLAGMRDWSIPNGARRWTWADGDSLKLEGFNGAIGWNEPAYIFGNIPQRTVPATDIKNVLIKFATASSGTAKNTNAAFTGDAFYADTAVWNASTDPNFSYGYRYVRNGQSAPARPEFTPYVTGITTDFGFGGYRKNTVPFSAWNTETTPPTRLAVGFVENNISTGLVEGRYWPYSNGVGIQNAGFRGGEWFFIFSTPYTDAVPNAAYNVSALTNPLPIMYTGTVSRRGGANVTAGDEFLIHANHINTMNDIFTFTAPATTYTVTDAKADVEKINVYPNPYFRYNSQETNLYYHFVTFNHLPHKATIRIFTLAGILVQTINKDDDSQFIRWNMRNDASYAAAAGMYIVHIDMPEIGKTKILKLAIVPATQFIDQIPPERKP
ncbi:MAG: T9SS type A sorting domain-containing protein [Bacteroidota bacterium]|nr:T9SS type A sorting domain-containing protein [Bacteroidota bacterium]